jgi:SAM-dependent methyltransferase
MAHLYDRIGVGYRALRRPDPRIAAAIVNALGPAASVVNVGAGAGSYEPVDRRVVAVEPSREMIRQRPAGAAPVVQASATALPFRAGAFDAVLAVLTVHHWPDRAQGLAELRRVARDRVVILTWAPDAAGFWLVEDNFPEVGALDRGLFPTPIRCRFRTTARTGSSAPTGAGRTPIWTPPSAARSPPSASASSMTWSPAWPGCATIWKTARGPGGTALSWPVPSSTSATASSSPKTLSPQGRGQGEGP